MPSPVARTAPPWVRQPGPWRIRDRSTFGHTLALVLAALVIGGLVAGCGEHEYERMGRELAERLVAEGYQVDKGLVYAPRGPVPHWVVELVVPGGIDDATAVCDHVAATVTYEGEAVYLVRVSYQPSGTVECGWGREPDGSPSPSPSAAPG